MKLNKILAGAFALLLTVGVSVQSNATDINKISNEEITVKVDPKKKEISQSELPAAVKQAITSGEFSKWNVAKAYKITYSDGEMTNTQTAQIEYEVHFQNSDQEKEIEVYDQNGKTIED